MSKLPQSSFNEGFYIWFNAEAKEEYYSTPLYMYKTDFNDDLGNYKRRIIQEKGVINLMEAFKNYAADLNFLSDKIDQILAFNQSQRRVA